MSTFNSGKSSSQLSELTSRSQTSNLDSRPRDSCAEGALFQKNAVVLLGRDISYYERDGHNTAGRRQSKIPPPLSPRHQTPNLNSAMLEVSSDPKDSCRQLQQTLCCTGKHGNPDSSRNIRPAEAGGLRKILLDYQERNILDSHRTPFGSKWM